MANRKGSRDGSRYTAATSRVADFYAQSNFVTSTRTHDVSVSSGLEYRLESQWCYTAEERSRGFVHSLTWLLVTNLSLTVFPWNRFEITKRYMMSIHLISVISEKFWNQNYTPTAHKGARWLHCLQKMFVYPF